jgi:hypothetical protein
MTAFNQSLAMATACDPRRNRALIDEFEMMFQESAGATNSNGDRMSLLSYDERRCLREWVDVEWAHNDLPGWN